MGKGKRSRDNKAIEAVNNAAAPETKNSVTTWTKVMMIAVALILVASMALIFIQSSGILLRAPSAFSSENYTINGAMMQYLFKTQYNDFYSSYYQYMNYFTLNLSKPLREQKFGTNSFQSMILGEFDGTWFDYFWDLAEKQARQTLIYCEAAKKAGLELTKEELDEIDAAIDSLSETAKLLNYPNTNSYIYALYGEGIKKSDIRDILKMTELATKYYDQETERILKEIEENEEGVLKFFEENKSDYLKADYILLTFEASLSAVDSKNPTATEKEAYEKAIQVAKNHADTVSKLKTIEEIEKYMTDFWFDSYYDKTYDDAIKKAKDDAKLIEDEIPGEAEAKENKKKLFDIVADAVENEKAVADLEDMGDSNMDNVLESVRNSLISQINSSLKNMLKETVAYSDSSDEYIWIFDEERKEADTKIFNSDEVKEEEDKEEGEEAEEEKNDDTKFTSTVYYIVKPRYIEEDITREFGHILISGDSFKEDHSHDGHDHAADDDEAITEELDALAKAEAERILAEFTKGELTKEAFEALAKDKNEDGNEFYADTKPGDMVTEMDEWLFAEDRKVNDTAVIKTQYGYHVTWLVEFGKEVWYVDSKNDFYNDTVEKWYEALEDATAIEENEKVANRIEA